jgi:membrane associated rhomboid family serine protease
MGATLVVLRRFGRDVTAVLVILGINVVLGFVVTGIDWRAHLGGLATGLVLSLAFAYAPRERRTLLGVLATVLVATVIVTVALVTTPTLPPL